MTETASSDTRCILVVDDEEQLRGALARFLAKSGFSVLEAGTANEAMAHLAASPVSVVLLDVTLPDASGIDLVPQILEVGSEIAIVMISGRTDAATAAACLQRGALDYLTKPLDLSDVATAIGRAVRRRDTLAQDIGISTWLKEEVTRQAEERRSERQQQHDLAVATLKAIITAFEAKSDYLAGHSVRVAAFAASVGEALDLSEDEIEAVRLAGWLHDLGNVGVPERVLHKQGTLSDEEFEQVREHVRIGVDMLAPLTELGPVVDYVRTHHESWDGSGYPEGLRGGDIPVGGRIVQLGEVYDALTTSRPYQKALTPEDAVVRMRELAGTVLDPAMMDMLADVVGRRQVLVFVDEGGGADR